MMNTEEIILLVDDDEDILEFLSYNLQKEGYKVYKATNGKEAIDLAAGILPSLIILDVMMPGMDGIEACSLIRQNPALKETRIAFLTARGEDYSQIAGFEAGADDYITKPIHPKVFLSRVKALLKRKIEANDASQKILSTGNLVIDREKYIVLKDHVEMVLPRKEFELLFLLASRPNKVFSREEIFDAVWGNDVIVGDRTIDVHIRKLREKTGIDNIITVKGVGYKFQTR
jgi:two-component system, OmpR family, alkaline phosphatase synthesis response regulator PhoP